MTTTLVNGQPPVRVVIERRPIELRIGLVGPRGPEGPPGQGITDYVFMQPVASDTWIINHNLGRKVDVALYTAGSVKMNAEVILISDNQAVANFTQPIAGFARVI